MAQHVQHDDPVRTERLAIEELFVLKDKGDETHYYTWLDNDVPECCPRCGGTVFKKQKLFARSYLDYIMSGNIPCIITLVYGFYKYHCLNPECRHIFTQEISFATVNDNVTHRLENRIAEMVIAESSYGSISSAFQEQLSRQAIGQIFNRWVRTKNEQRTLISFPIVTAIITGHTDKSEYTLILSCDSGIRILDILYGIDSERIAASLRKFSSHDTAFVLTDCDPTVYVTVKEALPSAIHIIPAEMWLKLVRSDFTDLAREMLRWLSIPDKLPKVLQPKAEEEENRSLDLRRIFAARKDLVEPYKDYHYLRSRIMDRDFRWTIRELDEWPESIDNTFRQQMYATLLQYQEYRSEIAAHQENWDIVPYGLLSATDRLEELIHARHTFSEEALQAAVLYSTGADPLHWQGVDIEAVINKLLRLQEDSGRNNHDFE